MKAGGYFGCMAPDGKRTAWDLLEKICEVVTKEPKRLFMDNWVTMVDGDRVMTHRYIFDPNDAPECGTVACVSGWGGLLLGKPLNEMGSPEISHLNMPVGEEAWDALVGVFYTFPQNMSYVDADEHERSYYPGTQDYVNFVVGKLRDVMNAHEDEFKRTVLR